MACESLRVAQVDANILDREYRQVIEQQISRLMIELPVSFSRLLERLKPEVHLLLDGVLWTSRVYRGASSGQIEMDISYKNYTPYKVFVHFLLSVVVPYLHSRLSALFDSFLVRRCLSKAAAIYEAISILHYLNFLRVGGHSTLIESYLNLRNWNNNQPTIVISASTDGAKTANSCIRGRPLIWRRSNGQLLIQDFAVFALLVQISSSTINYESQNRELLWHTFRDVLLLFWPAYAIIYEKWSKQRKAEVQTNDVALSCGKCGGTAVAPMRTSGCGHVVCYWCVASRGTTESALCAVCGKEEQHITPVRGRVLM